MERKFEIATGTLFVYVLVLKDAWGLYVIARLRGTFANYTHAIVSLLKAWNMTVVLIVCGDTFFNATSRRYTINY